MAARIHRIDGKMHDWACVPAQLMAALFVRLKTQAGMDASNTMVAQDGRLGLLHEGRQIDFRVACLPLENGETLVLRVLDPDTIQTIETIYPNQVRMTTALDGLARIRGKSGGLVLFSGPTGSGKTSSLYAELMRLPRTECQIITVENPVEYRLPFICQVQVNDLLKQKMSDFERSLVRQDPDVILLGEIRDADSAKAALRFTESGHLVFATVHADSAPGTLERFLSFIPEAEKQEAIYVMGHFLRAVVNQKLEDRLCSCASTAGSEPETADKVAIAALREAGVQLATPVSALHRAVGCPTCKGTGYRGRVAVHESLFITGDEGARTGITKALQDAISNVSSLPKMPGVEYLSKAETMARLLEHGLMDAKTVLKLLTAHQLGFKA